MTSSHGGRESLTRRRLGGAKRGMMMTIASENKGVQNVVDRNTVLDTMAPVVGATGKTVHAKSAQDAAALGGRYYRLHFAEASACGSVDHYIAIDEDDPRRSLAWALLELTYLAIDYAAPTMSTYDCHRLAMSRGRWHVGKWEADADESVSGSDA